MENAIITYGLNEEQVSLLEAAVQNCYQVSSTDCLTDLVVTNAFCTVIDAQALSQEGLRVLLAYYMDMGERLDETVVWIGKIDLPDLPSFVRYEDFLQLLLNSREIVTQAKSRYDTMQQYTDVYSYLPKHAIAECMEAEIFSMDGKASLELLHRGWVSLLKCENGPELLAAVYELTRWMEKSGIPFVVKFPAPGILLMLLLDPDRGAWMTEDKADYVVCVRKGDMEKAEKWLENHWYFRNPDDRFRLQPVEGLETGIATLDLKIMGMQPGEVILVGGRPAMGKTRFAEGVARHNGKTGRVLYVDLEEGDGAEYDGVVFLIGGTFGMEEIRAAATKAKADLLIIDRFQRITEVKDGKGPRSVMGQIKKLAQQLQIPILVTTELTNAPERRPSPIPNEKDIPNYRSILPYVDTVLLLYRPAYYDPCLDRHLARCITAKAQRTRCRICNGLKWDDEKAVFTD